MAEKDIFPSDFKNLDPKTGKPYVIQPHVARGIYADTTGFDQDLYSENMKTGDFANSANRNWKAPEGTSKGEINNIYKASFNREADQEGLDHWMKSGLTGTDLVKAIRSGAKGKDKEELAARGGRFAGLGLTAEQTAKLNADYDASFGPNATTRSAPQNSSRNVSGYRPKEPKRPTSSDASSGGITADELNRIYQEDFGRDVGHEGLDHWMKSDLRGDELRAAIRAGAKGDDVLSGSLRTGKGGADVFGKFADDYMKMAESDFNLASGQIDELQAQTAALISRNQEIYGNSAAAMEQLQQYTNQLSDKVSKQGDYFSDAAQRSQERYEKDFVPLEQDILGFAREYDTPERRDEAAAKAKADVAQSLKQSREEAQRRSMAMGVDPSSGRYAGIDRAADLGGAAASVGAQNDARENVENRGVALRADAANLGRALSGQALNQAGFAGSQFQGANSMRQGTQGLQNSTSSLGINANIAGNNMLQQNQALRNQILGIKRDGVSTAANIASTGQQLGLSKDQFDFNKSQADRDFDFAKEKYDYGKTIDDRNFQYAKAQDDQKRGDANTEGIWNAIGTGVGWLLSDENVKEDKQEIPDGEALKMLNEMRVEEWKYKDGVADESRHIGTYAQDFNSATGSGSDEGIPVQDAIGVTMKAVQDLNQKVDALVTGTSREGRIVKSSTNEKRRKKAEAQNSPALTSGGVVGTMAA